MSAATNKLARDAYRYFGATLLCAVGLAVVFLLRGLHGVPDGLVFAATIALAARFFGLGPSLLASALSIVAIDWTMLPPIGSVEFTHPEEITYSLVFAVLAVVISGTTHSLRLARAEAERVATRTDRLLAVTTALSEASLPTEVAHVVVSQGFDVLEAVVGVIAAIDGDEIQVLDRRRAPRATNEPSNRISLQDETPLTAALRRREPVWLESVEAYQERFPSAALRLLPDRSANAFLALPLLYGDRLVGGLVLGFEERTALGATDHTFAQLLAQSVGAALARAITFQREQHSRRDAEMLSRAREEVLGVVAHDLRNPLGVAGAVLQMVGDERLSSDERREMLNSGTRAVHQMNRLIGDLLDVMRMEAGRLSLEIEDLDARGILAQADETTRHLASNRHIEFSVQKPGEPLPIRGDRGRLAQVFGNLVGNAIKFTPEGGKVGLRAWRDNGDVVFEVADTGPGVPPKQLSHLFEKFWQADRADRRGVGLGLPIAKGIVDAHGGRLWVVSEPGKGSRFYVALPAGH
jgi:signal transduction histidine kinase